MARSTIGFSDRYIDFGNGTRRLFLNGVGLPRTIERWGLSGGVIRGLLLEGAADQLAKYTRTMNSWSFKTRCTVPSQAEAAPDGSARACIIHEDATAAATHYVAYTSATVAGGVDYVFFVWCGSLNRSWLRVFDVGTGLISAYYNVATGILGATPVGCVPSIIPFAGGYLCIGTFNGTVLSGANFAYSLGVADADNSPTFNGLNQDSLLVWGMDIKVGLCPSSHIINDGTSTVTRTSDTAIYWTNDYPNAPEGHLQTQFLLPDYTPLADVNIAELTDGVDYLRLKAAATTGHITVESSDTGSVTIATNICDGEIHVVDIEWGPSFLIVYLDGVASTADPTAVIPTGLTRVQMDVCDGVIGFVRNWNHRLKKFPQVD